MASGATGESREMLASLESHGLPTAQQTTVQGSTGQNLNSSDLESRPATYEDVATIPGEQNTSQPGSRSLDGSTLNDLETRGAPDHAGSGGAQRFPRFMELPPELRYMIWTEAILEETWSRPDGFSVLEVTARFVADRTLHGSTSLDSPRTREPAELPTVGLACKEAFSRLKEIQTPVVVTRFVFPKPRSRKRKLFRRTYYVDLAKTIFHVDLFARINHGRSDVVKHLRVFPNHILAQIKHVCFTAPLCHRMLIRYPSEMACKDWMEHQLRLRKTLAQTCPGIRSVVLWWKTWCAFEPSSKSNQLIDMTPFSERNWEAADYAKHEYVKQDPKYDYRWVHAWKWMTKMID